MNDQQVSHAKADADPTCGKCVHCMEGPNTPNDIMSRNCYRFPPVPLLTQMPGKGVVMVSVRPEIRVETPACGEYETPENEVSWDETS